MARSNNCLVGIEVGSQRVALECNGSTSMLLLGKSENVCSQTNLGLDFFLAVSKVVISKNGHHDAAFVPKSDLERLPIVVLVILVFPAHSSSLLVISCIAHMRQSQRLLVQPTDVWRKNYTSRCTCPMMGIQSCIVLGQGRISCISENTLHEVNIGDTTSRNKEANLHSFLRADVGNFRAGERTEHRRYHGSDGVLPASGVGQQVQIVRRLESRLQETSISHERNLDFVSWDGKAIVSNVKDPFSGTTVIERVVEHSIAQPVAVHLSIVKFRDTGVVGNGELPCHTVTIHVDGRGGEFDGDSGGSEGVIQKVLNTAVGGVQVASEKTTLFRILVKEIGGELEDLVFGFCVSVPGGWDFESIGCKLEGNQTVEGMLVHLFDSFSFIIQTTMPDEVFAAEVRVGHFVDDL
mmetsp:Transcript_23092/g.48902  ORF Transcript_23092/g.48902 Transcript_23092/m.48902 type:complete len:408 (-) Transcript_23092:91-1314(-)